ncbi:glycerophosphodiester phosphodiesterase [Parapusillimonas sp. SGNA-6]|nr:glycerophosphodiester phosphodiesterase [Parapusillimonas sp. SGNA-6]
MPDILASWPYPRLIAHRGAGRYAPENTLAAIRLGSQHGFAMVEYDVKLSRDDVAILLHDDTVDRTSNGIGPAAQMTFNELAALDFGAWHSRDYAGEPIPTLNAIAAFTLANAVRSNIEIKPHPGLEARTGAEVARQARALWAKADVPPLLSSFSETALEAALHAAPELPRALLIAKEVPADWLDRVQRLRCVAVHLNHKYTTRPIIQAIRSAGYHVSVWTVNDTVRAQELLDWGCNAIVTDEIKAISPSFFV